MSRAGVDLTFSIFMAHLPSHWWVLGSDREHAEDRYSAEFRLSGKMTTLRSRDTLQHAQRFRTRRGNGQSGQPPRPNASQSS